LKIIAFLTSLLTDLLFLLGFCSVLYGFWLVFQPLTYIIGGIAVSYTFLPLKKLKKGK